MAANVTKTIQSNIKSHSDDQLTKYALFLGGLDVTHDVLASYDPFIGGKARLFMTRVPSFITAHEGMRPKLKKFKHILEYANTGVSGINDIDVETATLTGGFVGRSFSIPTIARHSTDTFTVSTYEFSGRPVGELLHWWISGVTDFQSGFATYHDVPDVPVKESNHTAEFFYVVTDRTGKSSGIEYVCMFANCFPANIQMDHLNYRAGEANIAEMNIQFRCTLYDGPQINAIGAQLLEKYQILMDSMDFCPKFSVSDNDYGVATKYDSTTGRIVEA